MTVAGGTTWTTACTARTAARCSTTRSTRSSVLRDGGELLESVLAGPTCDSIDVIDDNILLPELEVGDLVVGRMMGAYTWASATDFNFFKRAKVVVMNEQPADAKRVVRLQRKPLPSGAGGRLRESLRPTMSRRAVRRTTSPARRRAPRPHGRHRCVPRLLGRRVRVRARRAHASFRSLPSTTPASSRPASRLAAGRRAARPSVAGFRLRQLADRAGEARSRAGARSSTPRIPAPRASPRPCRPTRSSPARSSTPAPSCVTCGSRSRAIVTLVRMGHEAREHCDEDDLCAELLRPRLLGEPHAVADVARTPARRRRARRSSSTRPATGRRSATSSCARGSTLSTSCCGWSRRERAPQLPADR